MNATDISIIAAGVALLLIAGLMFYLMLKGKKENCCEVKNDPSSGSLAEGTNNGLQPGPFWGVWGAPWQVPSERIDPKANLTHNMAQSSVGWGYSPYLEPPQMNTWWDPAKYGWYFDPIYWDAGVSLNLFHDGDRMCMDQYKSCVDKLGPYPDMRCKPAFEQCIASIPKVDEVSIGH
jgi:hypothetical protein